MLIRPASPATASGQMSKSSLARAVLYGAAATVLGGLPWGCKRSSGPVPAGSAPVAASAAGLPVPAAEPSRCRRLPGYALTLEGNPGPADKGRQSTGDEQEEDDEALLPFGVDMGAAVPTTYGFAAAGLRGAGQAFV